MRPVMSIKQIRGSEDDDDEESSDSEDSDDEDSSDEDSSKKDCSDSKNQRVEKVRCINQTLHCMISSIMPC